MSHVVLPSLVSFMICFVHYIILWTASENEGIKKQAPFDACF